MILNQPTRGPEQFRKIGVFLLKSDLQGVFIEKGLFFTVKGPRNEGVAGEEGGGVLLKIQGGGFSQEGGVGAFQGVFRVFFPLCGSPLNPSTCLGRENFAPKDV